MITFLILYTQLKKHGTEPYYFKSTCNCASFQTLNGTINDMFTGEQNGWNYNTAQPRPYFFALYPSLISLKILEFVISVILDYVVYQRLKREQDTSGKGWIILFTLFLAFITAVVIPMNISHLKMNINKPGKIYGNIWLHECNSGFVPSPDPNSLYNCQMPCVYVKNVYASNYASSTLYIECVHINAENMQGYDSYLNLLLLYEKLVSLSIAHILISLNDIFIGSMLGIIELVVKCCGLS